MQSKGILANYTFRISKESSLSQFWQEYKLRYCLTEANKT